MLRNYDDPSQDPVFSEITSLDLANVVPSISGPKRPHDRISVSEAKQDFQTCLTNKVSEFIYLTILKESKHKYNDHWLLLNIGDH